MPYRPQPGGGETGSAPTAPGGANLSRTPTESPALVTVREAADLLRVSTSWVRRHVAELPVIRCGRLLRIDWTELKHKIENGKSLKSERVNMTPRRYQRGSVIWKKSKKRKEETAFGIFRIDIQTANGIKRGQKKVRLGTRKELVTQSKARTKLDGIITAAEAAPPTPERMTFAQMAEKWKACEGPTLTKSTFDRYVAVLRAWLLPFWKNRSLQSITRDEIQLFLNSRAGNYSRSSIRAMRLVLQMTLSYAHLNAWIKTYPCVKIKTPRITNESRTVKRAEMTEQQKLSISSRLDEPYSTLVLLLSRIPVRIEEAIGIKETDLEGHVLDDQPSGVRREGVRSATYRAEKDSDHGHGAACSAAEIRSR